VPLREVHTLRDGGAGVDPSGAAVRLPGHGAGGIASPASAAAWAALSAEKVKELAATALSPATSGRFGSRPLIPSADVGIATTLHLPWPFLAPRAAAFSAPNAQVLVGPLAGQQRAEGAEVGAGPQQVACAEATAVHFPRSSGRPAVRIVGGPAVPGPPASNGG
jgi:hypothetical protein